MREVVDGVFELGIGYVNMHLVVTDDGVVLVDTGLPGKSAKIDQALHDLSRKIGDVRTVLLTHHHPDHTGNVADLRRRSGARVIAHQADVPYVTGDKRAVIKHPVLKVVSLLMGKPELSPVDDVITTDGSSPLPGFTALHTPGHTAGHVSYLLDRDGGVLFTGDAAAGKRGGQVGSTPKMVSDDLAQQARSVARLADLDFEHAVFGHGNAVSGRAVDRFREYVVQRTHRGLTGS
ncbi:MBL fold metallo-hydrolase [Actinoplanes friuliensis]|uniref:Putative metallo-beta-lactamase-like protein n=1 Tax=Actinoplanes friuliensis DSM 7358 TaxID=1246995 RepID=U5W5L6_9ACTN|nr:MBL fold metallo-hydrolase [Actinoplanes friuliensis]AGZ43280.1 putative metallo-beta-lactamase-like protein [Actinoplanes friuliensis DSM 7358]